MPQSYFEKIVGHDYGGKDGCRIIMDDATLRNFFRKQLVIAFIKALVKYCIYFAPARQLYAESGVLDAAELETAPWEHCPAVEELIAERGWEGKKLCTAMRRDRKQRKFENGKLKEAGVPDCCMADFLRYAHAIFFPNSTNISSCSLSQCLF